MNEQSRIYLVAKIVTVYVLMIVAVAWGTDYNQIPLYTVSLNPKPTFWLVMIWFLYYGVPFILAVIYGFLFRPFGLSFRNLWVTLIIIQLMYSFTAFTLRHETVKRIQHLARWSKYDRILISQFAYRYVDTNSDGFKDRVDVRAEFDLSRIRAGEYLLDADVVLLGSSVKDKENSPYVLESSNETIKIAAKADANKSIQQFSIALKHGLARPLDRDASFQIQFLLSRIITVDDQYKKIIKFTRWSPFLRITDWQGEDSDFLDNWVVLDKLMRPEVFTLKTYLNQ